MDAEQLYQDIQRLPGMAGAIRNKQPDAINFLKNLYKTVTGETVTVGCKGCHIKAANKLMQLTYQELLTMSDQKFKLHKNVSIEYPFRSGQRLTAGNLNDAKAAEYLYNHPAGVTHFAEFPKGDNGEADLSEWYPAEEAAAEPKVKEPAAPKVPKEPKAKKEPKVKEPANTPE